MSLALFCTHEGGSRRAVHEGRRSTTRSTSEYISACYEPLRVILESDWALLVEAYELALAHNATMFFRINPTSDQDRWTST